MVSKRPEGSRSERQFVALLEEMDSKITAIAEGHDVLRRELQETRTSLEQRMDAGFTDLRLAVGALSSRLEAHERSHSN